MQIIKNFLQDHLNINSSDIHISTEQGLPRLISDQMSSFGRIVHGFSGNSIENAPRTWTAFIAFLILALSSLWAALSAIKIALSSSEIRKPGREGHVPSFDAPKLRTRNLAEQRQQRLEEVRQEWQRRAAGQTTAQAVQSETPSTELFSASSSHSARMWDWKSTPSTAEPLTLKSLTTESGTLDYGIQSDSDGSEGDDSEASEEEEEEVEEEVEPRQSPRSAQKPLRFLESSYSIWPPGCRRVRLMM